jgi:hypothetical protein
MTSLNIPTKIVNEIVNFYGVPEHIIADIIEHTETVDDRNYLSLFICYAAYVKTQHNIIVEIDDPDKKYLEEFLDFTFNSLAEKYDICST